ncbi:MAG: hypothetical protein ACYDBV_09455, partial [Nitrospiria bacterium]
MKINQRVVFFLHLFVPMTAWAGQGWYLMQPPSYQSKKPPYFLPDLKLDASLSKWDSVASFDNAKEY